MKKLHLLKTMLLLCALIVGSSSVWAEDETITATQFGFTSNTNLSGVNETLTAENFTLTFAQNESTTIPVYNSSSKEFRLYKISSGKTKGASVTIASKSGDIVFTKIVFTFSNLPKYSFSAGSYDEEKNTWTGEETKSLTLTNEDFSGQLKIKSMVITYASTSSQTATTTTIDYSGIIKTDRKGGKEAGTLTASVTETVGGATVDGAEVTWSSSDEDVATIDPATGAVTLVAEGATTITASYAGNSTYAKSSDTYELAVTDTRAAAGLSYGFSEQTIHVGQVHEAFTLSNPNSLGVTYSSNSTAVATVNSSTGEVTGVAEGSATITAAFAGDNNYKAGQASYTLNVDVNSALDPVGPTNLPGRFVKVKSDGDIEDGDYLIVYEGDATHDACAFDGSLETLDAVGNTISIKFASEGVIEENDDNKDAVFTWDSTAKTLKSKSGYFIGKTAYSNGLDSDKETEYTNTIAITDGSAVITASGGCILRYNYAIDQHRFRYFKSGQQAIQLYKYVPGEEKNTFDVTVGAAGWRTIVTSANATLPSGIKAYIVTNSTTNSAKLTEKKSLKANTPYLLEATPETYTLTVTDDTPEEPTGNLLQISNASTTNGVYVLGNVEGVGFYKWTGGLLGAGRVYLPAPDPEAREFLSFDFEGETTAISEVRGLKSDVRGEFYNLNGQRVAQPSKGLYIVNGKKVMFK